ncbi:hypothetical protein KIPB_012075, partial [Kipferlia bialata]|eukprot:g12075.t1
MDGPPCQAGPVLVTDTGTESVTDTEHTHHEGVDGVDPPVSESVHASDSAPSPPPTICAKPVSDIFDTDPSYDTDSHTACDTVMDTACGRAGPTGRAPTHPPASCLHFVPIPTLSRPRGEGVNVTSVYMPCDAGAVTEVHPMAFGVMALTDSGRLYFVGSFSHVSPPDSDHSHSQTPVSVHGIHTTCIAH